MRSASSSTQLKRLLVIGCSAGGVDALKTLLPAIRPRQGTAAAVVIHVPNNAESILPEIFAGRCACRVKEGEDKEAILPDTIYFAPPGYHLQVEPELVLSLSSEEPLNSSRPSIDILFETAALALGPKVIGIIMTGANSDGTHGLACVVRQGGMAVAEDPATAQFPTMPLSALEQVPATIKMPLERIANWIQESKWNSI